MGCEKPEFKLDSLNPATGLGMAAPVHHPFYKIVLHKYQNKHFISWSGQITDTVVYIVSRLFEHKMQIQHENGIIFSENIYIYPHEYFCPLNYYTGELTITPNTRTIHHYHASWVTKRTNLISKIKVRLTYIYTKIYILIFH